MEAEHLKLAAETTLAIFGSLKFAHECYELLHHICKMKWAIRMFKF